MEVMRGERRGVIIRQGGVKRDRESDVISRLALVREGFLYTYQNTFLWSGLDSWE